MPSPMQTLSQDVFAFRRKWILSATLCEGIDRPKHVLSMWRRRMTMTMTMTHSDKFFTRGSTLPYGREWGGRDLFKNTQSNL